MSKKNNHKVSKISNIFFLFFTTHMKKNEKTDYYFDDINYSLNITIYSYFIIN